MFSQLTNSLLDSSVVFSFGKGGFLRHSRSFEVGDLSVDLSGKTALVTGANSGIGFATARGLAQRGATVILLCRNPERGREAESRIREHTGNQSVFFEQIDLASFDSIRAFCARLETPKVSILVHNAGVLPLTRTLTDSGLETTLCTNLVGPFLLTHQLLPKLGEGTRVIHVSSGGMYGKKLSTQELQNLEGKFDGVAAYARTKRAQVVLTELLAEQLEAQGILVHSMHPGWADTPGVESSLPRFHRLTQQMLRNAEEGADTVLWLSVTKKNLAPGGRFWFDRQPRRTHVGPWTQETLEERDRFWQQMCAWAECSPDSFNSHPG